MIDQIYFVENLLYLFENNLIVFLIHIDNDLIEYDEEFYHFENLSDKQVSKIN